MFILDLNGWCFVYGGNCDVKNQEHCIFRHQMSLGSDIVDAIKVCKKEGMEVAVIIAANRKTLNLLNKKNYN